MKKLLLSSIIMFGICGFVTAQNATGSKLGKTTATTTTSAAPTPQKSALEPTATPALTTSDAQPASDKVNPPAAPVATGKAARVQKTEAAATAVSADGTVTNTDAQDAQKKQAARAVAPASVKKHN